MSLRSLYPNVVFLKLNDVILNAKHLTKSSLFGGRDDKNLRVLSSTQFATISSK